MRGAGRLLLMTLAMLVWAAPASAEPPRLVKSIPADGASGVSVDVGKVLLIFDRNMKMNSWSLITSPQGAFPPLITQDQPWVDPVTFELKVERLKPNTTYAVQLNSESRSGFQTAEEQTPLPVTTIVFTTSSQDAAASGAGGPPAAPERQATPPATAAPPPVDTPPIAAAAVDIRPGWQFFVTRSRGIKGIATYTTGEKEQFQSFQKIEFTEEIVRSKGREISEVRRQIKSAVQHDLDSESGEITPTELAPAGSSFKLVHSQAGNLLIDGATGQKIVDEVTRENFAPPILPDLWPEGVLAEGQKWSYKGAEVSRRIGLFEVKGGEIHLQVEKVVKEPSTGLATAQIRGSLQTVIDLETIQLNYEAKVEIDLPMALGVPFMITFSGKLTGQGMDQDEQGRPIQYSVDGEGEVLQICKPAETVLTALGARRPAPGAAQEDCDPTSSSSAECREPTVPDNRGPSTSPVGPSQPGGHPQLKPADNGAPQSSQSPGPSSSSRGQSTLFSLYQEPYQAAFYMLIPKGWRAEGGMIPSGAQWNVVDLVEHNIKFRVTSPDGKSFFGWYPRFYFQDPAIHAQSSGGVLQQPAGGVLNGCWLYPYMDIPRYVQTIVFGQFAAGEFQAPHIVGAPVAAPELKPWVPQTASRGEAGYVNFQCSINGIPSLGRIYTIIYEIQGIIWTTVGTFGWVAPQDRWKQDARDMELAIRSFRLNPQWVQRAAAAERYRGQKYREVIGEMQRIDDEINKSRSQARSDMQEEFYKVITQQIETWDPEAGRKEYLPMYNHAWTNGRGDYFVRDYDDGTLPVENPTEWRKLTIINRNDPNYHPAKYGD